MSNSNDFGLFLKTLTKMFDHLEQGIVLFGGGEQYANRRALFLLKAEDASVAADMMKNKFSCSESSSIETGKHRIAFMEVCSSNGSRSRMLGLEMHEIEYCNFQSLKYVILKDFSYWKNQDEMRKDFISSISHRLRTPITSIHHALEVIDDQDGSLSEEQLGRFIEIGLRNIHKLISDMDELQKLFMVRSEERNGARGLFRIGEEIYSFFYRLEKEGEIKGFELESCDYAAFTQIGRLETFILTVVGLFREWHGEPPTLKVTVSGAEPDYSSGMIEISICCTEGKKCSSDIRDYLFYSESHRSLILERLAISLEGRMSVGPAAEVSLSIPCRPVFNREKDLIYPMNITVQEANAGSNTFCLVHLELAEPGSRRDIVLKELLGSLLEYDGHPFISMGEEEGSYLIFFRSGSDAEAGEWLEDLRERFIEMVAAQGLPYRGGLNWDVKLKEVSGIERSEIPVIEPA